MNSMQSIPDGSAKTDGIATGDAAAAAMIALRANDGSSPPQFYTPGPPVPRGMAGNPELFPRGRDRLSTAERNSLRYFECQ